MWPSMLVRRARFGISAAHCRSESPSQRRWRRCEVVASVMRGLETPTSRVAHPPWSASSDRGDDDRPRSRSRVARSTIVIAIVIDDVDDLDHDVDGVRDDVISIEKKNIFGSWRDLPTLPGDRRSVESTPESLRFCNMHPSARSAVKHDVGLRIARKQSRVKT